jgi:starch synthase
LHLISEKLTIMDKTNILFVHQEITPYLIESPMGMIGRFLPQGIQEKGKEIRTFMPRYGCINERRNQLHEVIRLSGMNLIINESDHPLIIKVASIQSARMQGYFIDNEDYFQRKYMFSDKDNKFFNDNDERSIFFCRGVLETVKKLGWGPNLVHCNGWFTSLLPIFLKKGFVNNPLFTESKVVYSVYNDEFKSSFSPDFASKIKLPGITEKDLKYYKTADYLSITKAAIDFSDGIIIGSEKINREIEKYISDSGKPFLEYQPADSYIDAYSDFYDEVLINETVLSA